MVDIRIHIDWAEVDPGVQVVAYDCQEVLVDTEDNLVHQVVEDSSEVDIEDVHNAVHPVMDEANKPEVVQPEMVGHMFALSPDEIVVVHRLVVVEVELDLEVDQRVVESHLERDLEIAVVVIVVAFERVVVLVVAVDGVVDEEDGGLGGEVDEEDGDLGEEADGEIDEVGDGEFDGKVDEEVGEPDSQRGLVRVRDNCHPGRMVVVHCSGDKFELRRKVYSLVGRFVRKYLLHCRELC